MPAKGTNYINIISRILLAFFEKTNLKECIMDVFSFREKVQSQKPLVHHITNWVTIYDCAQMAKSFGASPVMAHAVNEAADMASIASALVLNIGTLTDDVVEAMLIAASAANKKGIPVVLDVCGAGATAYRDQTCEKILSAVHIDIIKGNASEISRIAGLSVTTKGVDAGDVAGGDDALAAAASKVAAARRAVAVITGKVDIVADAGGVYRIANGHEMMASVVGTGCMAASVIGCFAAVSDDYAAAAASALSVYGIAGELAASKATGLVDFKNRFFDAASSLTRSDVESRVKVSR